MDVNRTVKRVLVWDFSLRIFHWAFAASITLSLGIGMLVDDDHPLFRLHMLSGIVAGFLLVVRLVLGLVGSRHARFTNFPLRPSEMVAYVLGVFTGTAKRYAGHSPGAAAAALTMFGLTVGLIVTGLGNGGEAFEDVHESLAYSLLAVVGLHLAGLLWHTVRHHENIAAAMISGRREGHPEDAIASAHPGWGLAVLAGGAAWITALFSHYDSKASTVTLPGSSTVLQLGENEKEHGRDQREGHDGRKRRHD